MSRTPLEWKNYYREHAGDPAYSYSGPLGCFAKKNGRGEETTDFFLWSPAAERVNLNLYRDGQEGEAFVSVPMEQQEEGIWRYTAETYLSGTYYDFEIWIEGEAVRSCDPCARACGANSQRSMVLDLASTDPEGWEMDRPPAGKNENVIYEIHVKEFSWDPAGGFPEELRGAFRALACEHTTLDQDGVYETGLDHLIRLGVTHVQLMPVYDYGSVDEAGRKEDFNWGYDPVNYNIPEGSYSSDPFHGEVRIRELKEAVRNLHSSGFRVIMDVVYNHTYSLDTPMQRCSPWYFYRVHEDGTVSNGSMCGNDIASERPMAARYILDSVLYWAEEYHIDGFRFDLMGLLDTELMNRIRKTLDERFGAGEKLVFGEPWKAGDTALEGDRILSVKENVSFLSPGIGMFCDDTRDAVKGSVFAGQDPGFVNGAPDMESRIAECVTAWAGKGLGAARAITYVSSHDNHTLWDKLSETTKDEELRRRQYRMAAALYLTCQGTPFLLSGEEFARTKDGIDNAYRTSININRLDWGLVRKEDALTEYYEGLLHLRQYLPALYDKSERASERISVLRKEGGIVCYLADNRPQDGKATDPEYAWSRLFVVYNSNSSAEDIFLPQGKWQLLADGGNSFHWKDKGKNRVFRKEKTAAEGISVTVFGQ